ncbi:MAG: hypothetical protein PHN72_02275 [Bacilli bacterium]|nr:hypothetical protein [Bacilli bacterium]
MKEYQTNQLKMYIEQTEMLVINPYLHIRLSKELLEKYKQGLYNKQLAFMLNNINKIRELGIKYPSNADPVFYVYIVPDENFRELLQFPSHRNCKGGGKPVLSYDLDGFNSAYGISSNLLERENKMSSMQEVNNIHEFAHLVHGMFFYNKSRILAEGFAEALPLYTMNYESCFDEHREMLLGLTEEQILSAQELIELERHHDFNKGAILPNKSCSFDFTYFSSYLFVRGCLETIESKFGLSRVESTQKFLEIVRKSQCICEWLIFDIADAIGVPREELLCGKDMQMNVTKKLKIYEKSYIK